MGSARDDPTDDNAMTKRTGQTLEEMAKGCHYWCCLDDWEDHKVGCEACGPSGIPGCDHGKMLWNDLVAASLAWQEETEALIREGKV